MAGTGVGKYSTTAGNNTDTQSVNFAEGMAPSNVNNAARETMANIRSASIRLVKVSLSLVMVTEYIQLHDQTQTQLLLQLQAQT